MTRAAQLANLHPRLAFDACVDQVLTLGVEEEHLLVHADSTDLAPVAGPVLREADGDGRIVAELRQSQIELVTPVCATAADADREIRSARAELVKHCRGLARPVAVGAHPTATSPGPVTEGLRYKKIVKQAPWSARELLTCGLHVHVGVRGADRALAVHDSLRSYLPLLIALGANSPFHRGVDAGVASVRAKLNATNPRYGVPPAFGSWAGYEEYLRWGAAGGVVVDPSYHWFDLRLNPMHGTIEVRAFDVQTAAAHTASLAALTHALVAWLVSRYDDGEQLPVHGSHLISESSFLAARDGTTGSIVDLDTGELVPVADVLGGLADAVRPFATALGGEHAFDGLGAMIAIPAAERQRLVASGTGLAGLVDWLARETASLGGPVSTAEDGWTEPVAGIGT